MVAWKVEWEFHKLGDNIPIYGDNIATKNIYKLKSFVYTSIFGQTGNVDSDGRCSVVGSGSWFVFDSVQQGGIII